MRVAIEDLSVSAHVIPTATPESDGTLEWSSTTLVLVELQGGGRKGLGYTYADVATARLIADRLRDLVGGGNAMDIPTLWSAMRRSIRNLGRPGICSMAIAAVDTALWDLKAKLLDVPLVTLFGAARESIAVYGSGGFTSYSIAELQEQLGGWAAAGIRSVKMKVGRDPAADRDRVRAARAAIGKETALFVDANGAYDRKLALEQAETFGTFGVTWFEEPVSSDDLEGLRVLRDRAPAGMDIAAGEYGYDLFYFRRMLEAGAVDVLQADATRCAGFSEFLRVAALCEANNIHLSAHTAPTLHVPICCAVAAARHVEYFFDHARIEEMSFDGFRAPAGGVMAPDRSRPGLGVEFKSADARRFAVYTPENLCTSVSEPRRRRGIPRIFNLEACVASLVIPSVSEGPGRAAARRSGFVPPYPPGPSLTLGMTSLGTYAFNVECPLVECEQLQTCLFVTPALQRNIERDQEQLERRMDDSAEKMSADHRTVSPAESHMRMHARPAVFAGGHIARERDDFHLFGDGELFIFLRDGVPVGDDRPAARADGGE
ncbi:MAG TPA: enolase C-terminal domain-like protein [Thermoanaerobaculia bacterium]|nr:enolase C-terminal domain-like protein [Thermoanaerobaculia bacterium]